MKKRALSLLLAFILVLSIVPVIGVSAAPVVVGEVAVDFSSTPVGQEIFIVAPTPPPGRQFTRWVTNRDDVLVFTNGTDHQSPVASFLMPGAVPAAQVYRQGLRVRAIFDNIPAPNSTLFNVVYYLSEVIGVRLMGTPNEERAAHYIADLFASFGLRSEVYTKALGGTGTNTWPNNMWADAPPVSNNVTAGLVQFSDYNGDFIGHAQPNTAAFGNPTGELVDFGTWVIPGGTGFVAPTGLTGDVVAAIRFDGAPAPAQATAFITAVETANPGINITGLLFTRSTGTLAQIHGPTGGLAGMAVTGTPTVSLNLFHFERAMERADAFTGLVWHTNNLSFSAMGVLPASTNDPDLLIVYVAHLDSVRSAAGADDNASGVASVVALAEHFSRQNRGNVEMWFVAAGGEEGNGMSGAVEAAQRVVRAGHREIAIVFNQDMISSPGTNSQWTAVSQYGHQHDTLGIDIWPTAIAGGRPSDSYGWPHGPYGAVSSTGYYGVNPFNLPAHLVITHATQVGWSPLTPISQDPRNIQNIRMYREGSTDHQEFGRRGIENASGIICEDVGNGLGMEYHNARDHIWHNYSYDRHNLVFNIFRNAAQTALNNQLSKRALLVINEEREVVMLYNAEQLFRFVERVEGNIGGVDLVFTPGNTTVCIADAVDFNFVTYGWQNLTSAQESAGVVPTFGPVVHTDPTSLYSTVRNINPFTGEEVHLFWAFGTGVADYRNAERNAAYNRFSTTLRAEFVRASLPVDPDAGPGQGPEPDPDPDPTPDPEPPVDGWFYDVASGSWYYSYVRFAVENEIMQGVGGGNFAPHSNLNRAMLATILWRIAGEPEVDGDPSFDDVRPGQWYSDAIAWAFDEEVVMGINDDEFAPYANITRAQFATMMFRFAQAAGEDTSVPEDFDLGQFADLADLPAWAQEAMAWAVYNGLIQGSTATTLNPQGDATRAQAAAILMRYMMLNA